MDTVDWSARASKLRALSQHGGVTPLLRDGYLRLAQELEERAIRPAKPDEDGPPVPSADVAVG
jgi:hypothetical protein